MCVICVCVCVICVCVCVICVCVCVICVCVCVICVYGEVEQYNNGKVKFLLQMQDQTECRSNKCTHSKFTVSQ